MNFQDVENARKIYHQKAKKAWQTTFIILLISAAIIFIPQFIKGFNFSPFTIMFSLMGLFAIFIVAVIIISFTSRKEAAAYRKAYKAYFIEQNLRKTFTNLQYDHSQGMDENLLRATGMINTGDRYSSNDLTIASYKDVKFAQADAHIQVEHRDSDGDTTYVTIFRGRMMIFEFPKKFNFKLELIGSRFSAARIPSPSGHGRKMSKINTESGEFNKIFKIYAEDGVEAFYILDPAFMVKIQNIADQYKNNLLMGFVDNKLLIALNNGKDSFEPPKASVPIDEEAELEKISNDIKVITDFVDQLSLDRKLFK